MSITFAPDTYFQDLIFSLQTFWARHNCNIMQPLDMEVGAGTFHPATFLRSIGPEPFSAAYVQPSRRPTDGRYGNNPNRLGHYYQFQVILKPSPKEIQDMYLQSLGEIGIDFTQHDIRFVEDNWESPTLGAWGLGWEVWLDGMEVSQFTYFQQVGGLECIPVAGELTYGLERLAMYLQGKDSVYDLQWNAQTTYGDIFLEQERQHSAYNFEYANTEQLFTEFSATEEMCTLLVEKHLPIAAYEQVIKASHLFNLLDARGVISVTDRARFISSVRTMSAAVAQSYYDRRKALGFPLVTK